MTKPAAPLRLRRVRFKDGRANIEVMTRRSDGEVAGKLRGAAAKAIETGTTEVVGYALVVWYADGLVFPAYHNGDKSPILAGQVPQYAKDVLLAEVATRWAKDE